MKNKKLFISMHTLGIWLIFGVFFMPDYFGIKIGFALHTQRLVLILIWFCIFRNRSRKMDFLYTIRAFPHNRLIFAYLAVCLYTALLRGDVGTFLYPLFDNILLFYTMVYLLKNDITLSEMIAYILKFAWILCILGIFEYIFKFSIFAKMEVIPGMYSGMAYRDGVFRITGPAHHPIGYGLFLLIVFPLSCWDRSKQEINLFHKPLFLILVGINIYLTGSRSSLGLFGLEAVVLLLVSAKERVRLNILIVGYTTIIFLGVSLLFYQTAPMQAIWSAITKSIDGAFGTSLSEMLGFDKSAVMDSTLYRKELPKIFRLDWLNPLLGRGSSYNFSWVSNGYWIQSIDNFYVKQYIAIAYPGLITFVLMSAAFLWDMLRSLVRYPDPLLKLSLIICACYFINLWWVDSLGTLDYVFCLFAAAFVKCQYYRNHALKYKDKIRVREVSYANQSKD